MSQNNRIEKIDSYVKKLSKEKDKWMSLAIAVDIADEIMKGILPDANNWHSQLNRNSQKNAVLPNPLSLDTFKTQKQQTWFEQHPVLSSARVALNHFSQNDCPIESRLYWFSDKETKQKVAVTTHFFDNWEDTDLTRKKNYKVGIDFFLSADTNKFFMVLSNKHKLRVMEFEGKLSNTQKQILSERLFTLPHYEKTDSNKLPQELIHKHLWDAFQLKEVNNKFYQGISMLHNKLVDHLVSKNHIKNSDARQFSSRLLGRLLFIWFLRKMELIDEDIGYFDTKQSNASDYYNDCLKRLFFHTLNTPVEDRNINILPLDKKTPYLNGGLFGIKENDYYDKKLDFPDNYFDELYAHFNEFNFTIDESSTDYQFVAVDPEMLGQIFESLLADQNDSKDVNERNRTGAFYTPRNIVEYMCKEAIRQYLYRKVDNANFNVGIDNLIDWSDATFMKSKSSSAMDLWGINTDRVKLLILNALDEVRIIDPAVGSGAFPISMMQLMSKLYERLLNVKKYDAYSVKLAIIANNIYGVDIQPMAVEIARLRAWLALIIEERDDEKVHPLPNLEFKFISANSLQPLDNAYDLFTDAKIQEKLTSIRNEYFDEANPENKKCLEKQYLNKINELQQFNSERNRQLLSFDPFNNTKSSLFYDSKFMFDIQDGFDVVIGNPPYIHFEKMDISQRNYYKTLSKQYYDTYAARGDIYTLFYEHGLNILREGGVLVYISSNKWMRAEYGKKMRDLLLENAHPIYLLDLGGGVFDSATVDTNILVLSKETNENDLIAMTFEDDNLNMQKINSGGSLQIYKQNESWTILSPIEQSIKKKIEEVGIPLREWDISIRRGVLTGLNEAFIISGEKRAELIKEDPKSAEIIRPILRGRDIKRYSYDFANLYVIVAHFGSYRIIPKKYPAIYKHLLQFEEKLKNRGQVKSTFNGTTKNKSDYPGQHHWLELDNNLSLEKLDDFSKQKIVWGNLCLSSQFAYAEDECFVNAPSPMIVPSNKYLLAVLNSKIGDWYIRQLGVTRSGGYFEYKPMFVEKLPVPKLDDKAQNPYIEVVDNILQAKASGNDTVVEEQIIDDMVYHLYALTGEEITFIENSHDIIKRVSSSES